MKGHLTRRRHDPTGRSTGEFSDPRFKKLNAVPPGQAFVWVTREMVESPAWRAMSQNARLVLDRVCVEHMAHAGGQNGFLPVTYDDFEHAGIRRGSIRKAIADALILGFLDMTRKGTRGWGEWSGQPSLFRLVWLPTCEGAPATFAWKRFASLEEAQRAVAEARNSNFNDVDRKSNSPKPLANQRAAKIRSQ